MKYSKAVAYDILGLPTSATQQDIVLRYKVLALRWHPDKNQRDFQFSLHQFKCISEAFFRLVCTQEDPDIRMTYLDMFSLFHHVFFGGNSSSDDDSNELGYDEYFDNDYYNVMDKRFTEKEHELKKAYETAQELIQEEENEKKKAEKKKAKKKRQKEKKRQQKSSENDNGDQENNSSKGSNIRKSNEKMNNLSDVEEDIDTSSAFVAVIAKKQKNNSTSETKHKLMESQKQSVHSSPEKVAEPTTKILRSRQLAIRGNELASVGHFQIAAELFTESIKLDPTDHRFYSNRSYCYDRLEQYEKALKDAEKSISLSPKWPKGYFRKARALLGLKMYSDAEQYFITVINLDKECEDAVKEIHSVRVLHIMHSGFTKEQAELALTKHSTVKEAIEWLLKTGAKSRVPRELSPMDTKEDEFITVGSRGSAKASSKSQHEYDIKLDPTNPEGHNSLWIGNVQAGVTERRLTLLFSKFGDLMSIKLMSEKFCAFVNYKNKTAPGKAMLACQGLELEGANLWIRFPNLPGGITAKKTTKAGYVRRRKK